MSEPVAPNDVWAALRTLTHARIGLARSGDTLSGADVRRLQADHAFARRAVLAGLEPGAMALSGDVVQCASQAVDRSMFMRRPDLGRRLAADTVLPHGPWDIVFVIADGLSAIAAQTQAPKVLAAMQGRLEGWSIAPIVLAHQARVALGDEIAQRMGARCVVMMIGERPGLTISDSLSLYITWAAAPGCRDSQRNCLSNIHDRGGLSADEAAFRLAWLLKAARRSGQTGIALKDESMVGRIAP